MSFIFGVRAAPLNSAWQTLLPRRTLSSSNQQITNRYYDGVSMTDLFTIEFNGNATEIHQAASRLSFFGTKGLRIFWWSVDERSRHLQLEENPDGHSSTR